MLRLGSDLAKFARADRVGTGRVGTWVISGLYAVGTYLPQGLIVYRKAMSAVLSSFFRLELYCFFSSVSLFIYCNFLKEIIN